MFPCLKPHATESLPVAGVPKPARIDPCAGFCVFRPSEPARFDLCRVPTASDRVAAGKNQPMQLREFGILPVGDTDALSLNEKAWTI